MPKDLFALCILLLLFLSSILGLNNEEVSLSFSSTNEYQEIDQTDK